jgi:hypothetical protein
MKLDLRCVNPIVFLGTTSSRIQSRLSHLEENSQQQVSQRRFHMYPTGGYHRPAKRPRLGGAEIGGDYPTFTHATEQTYTTPDSSLQPPLADGQYESSNYSIEWSSYPQAPSYMPLPPGQPVYVQPYLGLPTQPTFRQSPMDWSTFDTINFGTVEPVNTPSYQLQNSFQEPAMVFNHPFQMGMMQAPSNSLQVMELSTFCDNPYGVYQTQPFDLQQSQEMLGSNVGVQGEPIQVTSEMTTVDSSERVCCYGMVRAFLSSYSFCSLTRPDIRNNEQCQTLEYWRA